MFISKHYIKKQWTKLERQAAQARAFQSDDVYIIPVRLDDTEVPGVLCTVGYIDARNLPPRGVVKILKGKVLEGRAKDKTKTKKAADSNSSKRNGQAGTKAVVPKRIPSIVSAPGSFSHSGQISSSGTWLLLDDQFYSGAAVKTEAGKLVVEVKARTADEEAHLEALDPRRHPYQFHKQISFAHGNKAHAVNVESVESHSAGGKTVYSLKMRPQETHGSGGMGLGHWAHEAAERQVRQILLTATSTGENSLHHVGSGFSATGGRQVKAVFPPLWQHLRGRRLQPADALRCARLAAMYHLKSNELVEHISQLVLGPAKKGMMNVRFKGRRARQYQGEDAFEIEITGKCDLSLV
jgi:hypothetical protein